MRKRIRFGFSSAKNIKTTSVSFDRCFQTGSCLCPENILWRQVQGDRNSIGLLWSHGCLPPDSIVSWFEGSIRQSHHWKRYCEVKYTESKHWDLLCCHDRLPPIVVSSGFSIKSFLQKMWWDLVRKLKLLTYCDLMAVYPRTRYSQGVWQRHF